MLNTSSSFVTAVAQWCYGAGLLCLIFAGISLFFTSVRKIDLAVTVAESDHRVNIS